MARFDLRHDPGLAALETVRLRPFRRVGEAVGPELVEIERAVDDPDRARRTSSACV